MNALKNEQFLSARNCDQFHSTLARERESNEGVEKTSVDITVFFNIALR